MRCRRGPEHVRREAQRQQQRDRDRDDDEEDDRRRRRCRPAPKIQRGTSMKLAPRKAATAPIGGGDRVHRDHLLAGHHVRQRRRQTRGDEAGETVDDQRADTARPDRRHRRPAARRRRARAPAGRRWRRSAPTAGPSGPSARPRTDRAASTAGTARRTRRRSASGSAARSGLNSSAPARPAWNSPSPNWLAVRSSSSRQKSGSARTERQTATPCADVGH